MKAQKIKDYIEQEISFREEEQEHHEIYVDIKDHINFIDQVKDMLDQLDTEWVSVNDRLPSDDEIEENKGQFLVTQHQTTPFINKVYLVYYGYSKSLGKKCFNDYDDYNDEDFEIENVVAWKKIEPYKESEE